MSTANQLFRLVDPARITAYRVQTHVGQGRMLGCIARSHLSILAGVIGLPLGAGTCAVADGNGISDVLFPASDETLSPFTRNFSTDQQPAIPILFGIVVVQIAILMAFWIQMMKRQRAERSPRPISVTAKAQGPGLAISRSILSAHDGKIWCGNNAGGASLCRRWNGGEHGQTDRDRLSGR